MADVDIRLASARVREKSTEEDEIDNLVTPGDVITADTGFMRYIIRVFILKVISFKYKILWGAIIYYYNYYYGICPPGSGT